jgi:hypothetical protein
MIIKFGQSNLEKVDSLDGAVRAALEGIEHGDLGLARKADNHSEPDQLSFAVMGAFTIGDRELIVKRLIGAGLGDFEIIR